MDRYKFKNSKFVSVEDAKKVRTLVAENDRKIKRNNTFFQNRVLSTPTTKIEVSTGLRSSKTKGPMTEKRCTKKYSTKEISELSKLRYQKMLLYKEEKKRAKKMDVNRRQPVFHAGLYQHDAASFLSAKKKESVHNMNTPINDTSRLTMAGRTPATMLSKKSLTFAAKSTRAQKEISKKSNVSVGVTRSSKRAGEVALLAKNVTKNPITCKAIDKSGNISDIKGVLSVKNVELTPSIFGSKRVKSFQKSRLTTPRPSFAPKNFQFLGVPGIKPIKFNTKKECKSLKKIITKNRLSNKNKENVPVPKSDFEFSNKEASPEEKPISPLKSQSRVTFHKQTPKLHSPIPLNISEGSVNCGNETLSDAEIKLMASLNPLNETNHKSPENDKLAYMSEDYSPVEKKLFNTESVITSPKSIIRKEKNKKVNFSVSFVTAEHSGKKEIRYKGTPIPRRSSRISRSSLLPDLYDKDDSQSELKLMDERHVDDLINCDTLKSSNGKKRKSKGKESIKKISSLQRRRISKPATPLEKMFSDIEMESPLPLNYSDDHEESFNCNDTLSDSESKLMALLNFSKANEQNNSPDAKKSHVSNVIKKKGKNKSSVSFVTKKESDKKKVCHKGTPLPRRRSSRISRISLLPGLFDKEDCSSQSECCNIDPSEDLINFDTPKVASSNKRQSRSARLSSLPDFTKEIEDDL